MMSYSYLIYRSDQFYYARNGETGVVDYSGTDATIVIQSAINNLILGGLIFFKRGIYIINSTLIIPSGRVYVIVGEGRTITQFVCNSKITNFIIVGDSSNFTEGFSLKDIRIDGGGSYIADLITLRNTKFTNIDNVYLVNFKTGIIIDPYGGNNYAYFSMIKGCEIQGAYGDQPATGTGLNFKGIPSHRANANVVIDSSFGMCDIGIHVEYGDDNVIIGCNCSNGNIGYKLDVGARWTKIIGSRGEENIVRDLQIVSGAVGNEIMANSFVSTNTVSDKGDNTRFWNNLGYITENKGILVANGTGIQKSFAVSHGLSIAPTSVQLEAKSADTTGYKYWVADKTNITINFIIPPPEGINNIIVAWKAEF